MTAVIGPDSMGIGRQAGLEREGYCVYIPKPFQMKTDEAVRFMASHPLALLITVDGTRPVATHIPVDVTERNGNVYVTGHIAAANPQKHTLRDNQEVLLVFQGPQAYISSSWYAVEEVPTWDYLAVHAYGTVRVLTLAELKTVLESMLIRYESHRENGRLWATFHPALLEREMRAIVGFEVEVTEVQAAAKMSQNRTDEDYRAIVTALEKSNDAEAQKVAEWMRNRRPQLF